MQARPGVDKSNLYSREWHVDPDIPMSEDRLYLNVWTPAVSPDERLPVFVWYFGGALQVGYTAEMEFDGERIAGRGVVVVTVNYRVNVFGFMCHPEITREAPEAPANFGHLDQQFATRWVQRNIAAFGGDPNNITIGGQSAGGGSVLAQLTSPQNEGLSQRAIIQSGIFAPVYPSNRVSPGMGQSLDDAERRGVEFLNFLGASSLEEARGMDAQYVMAKALEYKRWWGTVIDNEFLELCQFESGSLDEVLERASVNSIEYAIRVAGKANADTGANTPLYYYVFDAEIPGWDNPGAFHSVDLWFFFETLAKCWRPFVGKHYDLARQMCNYWAYFMKNGDPNGVDATGERMPEWAPYTSEEPFGMAFRDKAEFRREDPSELMRFLVEQYTKR